MEVGVGREAMSVMCDIFNMPPPCHHKAWDQHVAALYVAHKKTVAEQLQKARNKVFSLHCQFTFEECSAKDNTRMVDSVRQAAAKEKERRRKRRQAKLEASEGECSYASGLFNDVDPLDFDPSSSSSDDDDFDHKDDYPLARFALNDESDDSNDVPLAQFASRMQEK